MNRDSSSATNRGGVFAPARGKPVVTPTRNPTTTSGGFRAKVRSFKNNSMINCESLLERHAVRLFEVAPDVVSYSEQPPAMKLRVLGGRACRYTPDLIVHWASGETWLVEIKPAELAREPQMRAKLLAAAVAAEREGHVFVVVTDEHVEKATFEAVAKVLEARRRHYVLNLGDTPTAPVRDDPTSVREVTQALLRARAASPTVVLQRSRQRCAAAQEMARLNAVMDEIRRGARP